jgi:hypothetical protein
MDQVARAGSISRINTLQQWGQASFAGQHALTQRPQLLDDALAFGFIPGVNDWALFWGFHFFASRLL